MPDGRFDAQRFAEQGAPRPRSRLIEIKLSQGAKPGHGGVLPGGQGLARKSRRRAGVPAFTDCLSPAMAQRIFDADRPARIRLHGLARKLADGKPVGFKLWRGATRGNCSRSPRPILATSIAPDFIVVDGAEGGHRRRPPAEFVDHVGMPLQEGLLLVHNTLVGLNLREARAASAPAAR